MTKIIDLNNYRDPEVRILLALGDKIDQLIKEYIKLGLEPHEVGAILGQRLSVLIPHMNVDKEGYIDFIIEMLITNGGLIEKE